MRLFYLLGTQIHETDVSATAASTARRSCRITLANFYASFATPYDEPGSAGVSSAECGQDARAPRSGATWVIHGTCGYRCLSPTASWY